jgi:hypothetical protein
MEVNHLVPGGAGGPVLVEPEVGEHVAVTAFWRPAANCQGLEATESATADVAWSGSSWTLSNVNLTSNINALTICLGASCSYGGVTHSWQYKLITDVTDPGPNGWNLQKVRYEITDVDDGDTIAGPQSTSSECVEVSAVTPTSQSFTGWDNPNDKWSSSRCAFSCDAVGGSMTVTYQ